MLLYMIHTYVYEYNNSWFFLVYVCRPYERNGFWSKLNLGAFIVVWVTGLFGGNFIGHAYATEARTTQVAWYYLNGVVAEVERNVAFFLWRVQFTDLFTLFLRRHLQSETVLRFFVQLLENTLCDLWLQVSASPRRVRVRVLRIQL